MSAIATINIVPGPDRKTASKISRDTSTGSNGKELGLLLKLKSPFERPQKRIICCAHCWLRVVSQLWRLILICMVERTRCESLTQITPRAFTKPGQSWEATDLACQRPFRHRTRYVLSEMHNGNEASKGYYLPLAPPASTKRLDEDTYGNGMTSREFPLLNSRHQSSKNHLESNADEVYSDESQALCTPTFASDTFCD